MAEAAAILRAGRQRVPRAAAAAVGPVHFIYGLSDDPEKRRFEFSHYVAVRAAHTAQDLEFPRELKAADWPAQGPLVLTVWMDALRLQVLPLDLNPKL